VSGNFTGQRAIRKETMGTTNTVSDDNEKGTEDIAAPESGTAPLRQLLHWVTGDRDAEAKALADETQASRAHGEPGNSTEPDDVLLAAAKDAVSVAHGDSHVSSEVDETDETTVGQGSNPLTDWEHASGLENPHPNPDPQTSGIDGDVARPADVENIAKHP
jgi:hypothetical protein